MDQFNSFQILGYPSYIFGACVLYPDAKPSKVCIEVVSWEGLIGRVTYDVKSFTSELALQSTISRFIDSNIFEKVILGGDLYNGHDL